MRLGPIIGGLDDLPLGARFPFVRDGAAAFPHVITYEDEFVIGTAIATSTVGTGTAGLSNAARGGCAQVSSGATLGGIGRIIPSSTSFLTTSWQSPFWAHARVMFNTAMDSQASAYFALLSNAFGNPEIALGLINGVGSGSELGVRMTNDAGGVITTQGLGITVDQGVWHDFEIANEGTFFRFAIDGKEGPRIVPPSSAGVSCTIGAIASNGTTAANRQMLVKRWAFVSRPA